MIHNGALQYLDYIYIDFHTSLGDAYQSFKYLILLPFILANKSLIIRGSIAAINKVMANKNIKLERFTKLTTMDDESYGAKDELKPLPDCEIREKI